LTKYFQCSFWLPGVRRAGANNAAHRQMWCVQLWGGGFGSYDGKAPGRALIINKTITVKRSRVVSKGCARPPAWSSYWPGSRGSCFRSYSGLSMHTKQPRGTTHHAFRGTRIISTNSSLPGRAIGLNNDQQVNEPTKIELVDLAGFDFGLTELLANQIRTRLYFLEYIDRL